MDSVERVSITVELSRDEARLIVDELLKESDRRRTYSSNRVAAARAEELDNLALRIMDAVDAQAVKPDGVSGLVWNLAQECMSHEAVQELAYRLKKGDIQ